MELNKLKIGESLVLGSVSRGCYYYKAKDGKWYCALNEDEYEFNFESATHYGPFSSQEKAHEAIRATQSNPGGFDVDDSGEEPVPKDPESLVQKYGKWS